MITIFQCQDHLYTDSLFVHREGKGEWFLAASSGANSGVGNEITAFALLVLEEFENVVVPKLQTYFSGLLECDRVWRDDGMANDPLLLDKGRYRSFQ